MDKSTIVTADNAQLEIITPDRADLEVASNKVRGQIEALYHALNGEQPPTKEAAITALKEIAESYVGVESHAEALHSLVDTLKQSAELLKRQRDEALEAVRDAQAEVQGLEETQYEFMMELLVSHIDGEIFDGELMPGIEAYRRNADLIIKDAQLLGRADIVEAVKAALVDLEQLASVENAHRDKFDELRNEIYDGMVQRAYEVRDDLEDQDEGVPDYEYYDGEDAVDVA